MLNIEKVGGLFRLIASGWSNGLLVALSISFFISTPASALSVDSWLDKMARAMHQQNYQGTLVIRQNGKLQAVKVKQGVTEDGSWQTLESLTGENQTIFRQNGKVTTIFPAKKTLTVSSASVSKGPLHPWLPEDHHLLKKYYLMELGEQDRIANKSTQIIRMIPRDKQRYGYTFWLDQESGFLLKCNLLSSQGKVLEQQMYSNVELLTKAPENQIDMAQLSHYKKLELSSDKDIVARKWRVNRIPRGFLLTRSVKTQQDSYHMVFSDGMASVSVFIEPRKKKQQLAVGRSSMGSVHAFSTYLHGKYVTAIGEVPASTVRMMAQSIHPESATD